MTAVNPTSATAPPPQATATVAMASGGEELGAAFDGVRRQLAQLPLSRRGCFDRLRPETITYVVNLLAGKVKRPTQHHGGGKPASATNVKAGRDRGSDRDRGGTGTERAAGPDGGAAVDELELPYWEMVEDFFRDLSREDLELVLPRRAQLAQEEVFLVPPCGRHYKQVWEDEDAAELLRVEALRAEQQAARKRKMLAASPGAKGKGKGVEATSLPPLTTVISPIQEPESELCHVCCEGESTEENVILYCEGCNVAVHQVCYGVKEVPAGEWYCNACAVGYEAKSCILCGVKGGALKPVAGPGLGSYHAAMAAFNARQRVLEQQQKQQPAESQGQGEQLQALPQPPPAGAATAEQQPQTQPQPATPAPTAAPGPSTAVADNLPPIPPLDPGLQWAHLFCSQWIPETFVSNLETMEPIENINGISKERWRLVCCLCKERTGACIQCSFGQCAMAFHPLCAKKHMLRMEVSSRSGNIDEVELRAFCPKHSKQVTKKEADEAEKANANDATPHNPTDTANNAANNEQVSTPGPAPADEQANNAGANSKAATPGSAGGESGNDKPDGTSAENTVPQDLLGTCKEEEVKALTKQYMVLADLSVASVAQKTGTHADVLNAWLHNLPTATTNAPEAAAGDGKECSETVAKWLRSQGVAVAPGCNEEQIKALALQRIAEKGVDADNLARQLGGAGIQNWLHRAASTTEAVPAPAAATNAAAAKPTNVVANAVLTEKVRGWLRAHGGAIGTRGASKEQPGAASLPTVSSITTIADNLGQLQALNSFKHSDEVNRSGAQPETLKGASKVELPSTVKDLASPKKLAPTGLDKLNNNSDQLQSASGLDAASKLALQTVTAGESGALSTDREYPHPHTTILLQTPLSILQNKDGGANPSAATTTTATGADVNKDSDRGQQGGGKGDLDAEKSCEPMQLPDVLAVAPDDEIVAEMLVLHKELITQLHANRQRCAKLCGKLLPELEGQEDKTRQKLEDLIEVEQYMSAIREIKRLQRKEKKEKEHAAAVAAAEAAALASSRRSQLPPEELALLQAQGIDTSLIPPKQPRAQYGHPRPPTSAGAKDGKKADKQGGISKASVVGASKAAEQLRAAEEKVNVIRDKIDKAERVGKLMGKLLQMFDLLAHREQVKESILKSSRDAHWQSIVDFMQQQSGPRPGSSPAKDKGKLEGSPPMQRKLAPATTTTKRKLREVELAKDPKRKKK
mmetsp:Transcript_8530/g.31512  ORF Transcript_8530/g.31512 Transcript_8530/m.31512 type:complete len:1209 (+) Transcript_8530:178-3804(+)